MASDLLCAKDSQLSLFSIAVPIEVIVNKTCSFHCTIFRGIGRNFQEGFQYSVVDARCKDLGAQSPAAKVTVGVYIVLLK